MIRGRYVIDGGSLRSNADFTVRGLRTSCNSRSNVPLERRGLMPDATRLEMRVAAVS